MTGQTLCLIPARAGSKRVPNKNLRELAGKPLIAHTIEHACQAETLDQVAVSSENSEIQDVAESYGINTVIDRPASLATDTSTASEVVEHALTWFEDRGESFDYVCLLLVTAPFRTVEDVDEAVEKLYQSDATSIVSVVKYDAPPFWAVQMEEDRLEPYFAENPWDKTRSQEFPTLHHPNGAVFAAKVSPFRDAGSFYTENVKSYEMPQDRSLDIDEPFDLELARALHSWREK